MIGSKHTLWASVAAAIGASMCCVMPLVLVTLGIGGAWIATLKILEPWRPIFVVLTLALLALSWHRLYRQPAACEVDKPCATDAVQDRHRLFFWLVAIPVVLLLAFPWYAPLFY